MGYGLRVKNDSGELLIDSTYRNYEESELGTRTITNNNTSTTWYTSIGIASSPLVPLILFRPNTNYYSSVVGYGKSGSNYNAFYMATHPAQSTSINYICCRQSSVASAESYGLRVKNPSGDLVFDSGKKYFKVHSVHTISLSGPSGGSTATTITHSGISNPYYILSSPNLWTIGNLAGYGAIVYHFRVGLKKISTTQVSVGWYVYANYFVGGPALADSGENQSSKLIVCDTIN